MPFRSSKGVVIKRSLFFCISLVIVFTINFSLNLLSKYLNDNVNGNDFKRFNTARCQIMDYPHLSFEDAPELWEKNGFTETSAALLKRWCFLDDNVNSDTLESFFRDEIDYKSQNYEVRDSSVVELPDSVTDNVVYSLVKKNIKKALHIFLVDIPYGLYRWDGTYYGLLIKIFIYFFIAFSMLIYLQKEKISSLLSFAFLGNFLGTLLIYLYLLSKGRMPLRVVQLIFYMAISTDVFFLMKVDFKFKSVKIRNIVIIFFMFFIFLPVRYVIESKRQNIESVSNSRIVSDFVRKNTDNVYVYSFSAYCDIDPFSDTTPNLVAWGGSMWLSDLYKKQLEFLGIEKLDMDILMKDNVYFIATEYDIDLIMKYFDERRDVFGLIYYRSECKLTENATVYKICSGNSNGC